ncbi:Zn-ribbon domain-containing OB-fold protein [Celeribacter sp.]|uniref:Zn-ribbon domain-containing OB-fold protein n=1 Tax=Celeribacter sp. TaxID=1890673 RepID=UPI003A90E7BD
MKYHLALDYTLATGRMAPFFTALAEGRACASSCTSCGQTAFPPRATCVSCHADGFDWVDLTGEAEVLHITHTADAAFALVQFDGADTTALVRIAHDQTEGTRGRLVRSENETGLWLEITAS